jgi:hypothetical protein
LAADRDRFARFVSYQTISERPMLDFIIHVTRFRSTLAYLYSRHLSALMYPIRDRGISGREKASEKNSNHDVTDGSAGHGTGDTASAD